MKQELKMLNIGYIKAIINLQEEKKN